MKKSLITTAVAAALAVTAAPASAVTQEFTWTGMFTMLDPVGNPLANSSTTAKGANQFQTPIIGTMAFDKDTGAGTATLTPFQFFGGNPTLPASAVGINMQAIGDGFGDPNGTLVLGNMLFNWNSNNGIPVSIVMDAAGFFTSTAAMWADGTLDQADVALTGATPESDGGYSNGTFGYLDLGPAPMATTHWDTTNELSCGVLDGSCAGNGGSGRLPIFDGDVSQGDFDLTTPTVSDLTGDFIGGSPMMDGPFPSYNANFDVLSLTMTDSNAGYTIAPFDVSPQTSSVPVPAAVWLFGSGLLGLVGVARRKKS